MHSERENPYNCSFDYLSLVDVACQNLAHARLCEMKEQQPLQSIVQDVQYSRRFEFML